LFRICVFLLLIVPGSPLEAAPVEKSCGRVLDASSQPVPGASVTLYSRDSAIQVTTQSDENGKYCFAEVPRGDYFLQAQASSLRLAAPQPIKVQTDIVRWPDLLLAIVPVSTQVTVTAAGFPQSASETSKELNVVNVSAAEELGQDSLVDAVRELPGLRVSQGGGPGSLANIQIRGLRTFDTSITIDGTRQRDVSATQGDATAFLSDLWFTDTDRVEVLQGAGASLYGTNAIGGVVNLVTDHGGGATHGDLDVQGGMLAQFRGRLHLAGGGLHERLFYSLGFGHFDVMDGVQGSGRYRNSGGLGLIEFVPTPKLRVGARVLGTDVFGQLNDDPVPLAPNVIPSGAIEARPLPSSLVPAAISSIASGVPYSSSSATFLGDYPDPDNSRAVNVISSLVFLEHQIAPSFHYRLQFQDFDVNRSYVNGPAGLGFQPFDRTISKYRGRTDTATATAQWNPVQSQLLSAGYEFEREDLISSSGAGQSELLVSRSQARQTSHAVFLQDQTRLFADRLQISLSGRWQGFGLSAPTFSVAFPVYKSSPALSPPSAFTGDASVAYFFRSTGTKIRSHVGNAYRAPTLYERFGTYFFANNFSAIGDPRLSPERALSLDGGIDQYFRSDRLKLSASYFYTRLQETVGYDPGNLVVPGTDPFLRFGGYFNLPGGLARGVEVSGEARLGRGILVRAAYTYTSSIDRVSQYSSGLLNTPRIFPHTFTFSANKHFGQRVDAAFDFLAGSRFVYPLFEQLPPYSALAYSFDGPRQAGLSLAYTQPVAENKSLRIYVRFDNLTDQQYFDNGFLTPGLVVRGGFKFAF
jgi:outer membrane receptor protein involved in Fe transport